MHYIKTRSGIKWHYLTSGNKEPLVLLHGWSFDSSVWKKQMDALSHDYLVIAIDLPGCGRTSYVKDVYLIDALYEFTQALKLGSFNLMGHSFGGLIALQLGFMYPEIIKKLILIGTNPKFVCDSEYTYGLSSGEIAKLREMLNREYPKILIVFTRWLFTKKERDAESFRLIWSMLTGSRDWPKQEALKEMLDVIEREDLRKLLSKIQTKTLIISGSHDPICPKAACEYLNRKLTHSHMEIFEGCGHLPFATQSNRFNNLVKDFLKH